MTALEMSVRSSLGEGEDRAACTATRHDDLNAHQNYRCRCPLARRANSRYSKQMRIEKVRGERRLINATGTIRRLQALAAIGWTQEALGEHLGVTRSEVGQIMQRPNVTRGKARQIVALYERLWDQPGPSRDSERRALASGCLPPMWWDDDRIDDPTYDPRFDVIPDEPVKPSRVAEVHRLTRLGLSAAEIAERLGVSQRQVVRDRAEQAAA